MRRLAVAAVVGALLTLAVPTAPPAAAHAARIATDPLDGSTLATGPQRVSATFNERLQTSFGAMTVVGPDANLWSSGDATVQGAVISVALRPLGPAGAYTVHYRVTSADGHVVSGSWSFALSTPGTGSPGPPAAAPPGSARSGIPVWPFVAVAVALVAGGAWWAGRRR